MSHVNALIPSLEERYGIPDRYRLVWHVDSHSLGLLTNAAQGGRCHDLTFFIRRGEDYAVIRKPSYPIGLFRPPSGGVERGESIEAGARREAYEEAGVRMTLSRYLMRADVTFVGLGNVTVPWCTHVLVADWRSGEPRPVDRREIEESRWASDTELTTALQDQLDASPDSGLRYRGWVQRAAFRALGRTE
jgi:ADP-ribose pyrophosphatase YjhB (NUDIX family)